MPPTEDWSVVILFWVFDRPHKKQANYYALSICSCSVLSCFTMRNALRNCLILFVKILFLAVFITCHLYGLSADLLYKWSCFAMCFAIMRFRIILNFVKLSDILSIAVISCVVTLSILQFKIREQTPPTKQVNPHTDSLNR